jgi:ribosomal protein L19E
VRDRSQGGGWWEEVGGMRLAGGGRRERERNEKEREAGWRDGGREGKKNQRRKRTHLWYCAWRKLNSSLIRSQDSGIVNLNCCPGCGGP